MQVVQTSVGDFKKPSLEKIKNSSKKVAPVMLEDELADLFAFSDFGTVNEVYAYAN